MILSFQPEFVESILDGSKIHTIRPDKTSRWEIGKKIHFATGVRTKQYHCFKQGVCRNIQEISIDLHSKEPRVKVDGELLEAACLRLLAAGDGFANTEAMMEWFRARYGNHSSRYGRYQQKHELFTGRLIHWTDAKYDSKGAWRDGLPF